MRGRGKEILVGGEDVHYLDCGDCFMNILYVCRYVCVRT